ncbi:unnamed protein product [Boreogadus saida]
MFKWPEALLMVLYTIHSPPKHNHRYLWTTAHRVLLTTKKPPGGLHRTRCQRSNSHSSQDSTQPAESAELHLMDGSHPPGWTTCRVTPTPRDARH